MRGGSFGVRRRQVRRHEESGALRRRTPIELYFTILMLPPASLPLRELVAPRVLACMLTLPLLTLFIVYLALAAGFAAEALGEGGEPHHALSGRDGAHVHAEEPERRHTPSL